MINGKKTEDEWINSVSTEKEIVRTKKLIVYSSIVHSYTMVNEFKTRAPIFP